MVTLYRRGGIWCIQYRIDGKQVRKSLKTKNKKLADEIRLQKEVELGPQRFGLAPILARAAEPEPDAPPKISVEDALGEYEQWSKAHKRPRTIKNDLSRLRAFFATVEGKALAEIGTADVERYLVGLASAGRSPATLLRNREITHAFWRWAARQGHVEGNVVSDIPRPRLPERDPEFLSLEQIDELLGVVEGTAVEPIVATAVFAGLRREELCWLTWRDVELDRVPGMLRIRAKTIDGESWESKTKRDRKIPISPRLLSVLKLHRENGRRKSVPWLFPSPEARRWDPDNLSRAIRRVLKASGLECNLLTLRHTFGSQLAQKGVSLLKIARLMGNSPAIASRHYINLVPEEMADDVAF